MVYQKMIKRNLKCLICFVLMHGMIICFANQGYTQENQINKGTTDDVFAADFTLKDTKGKNYRLSDYKGKIILLNFMATWCPECRTSTPYLKAIYSQHNR